MKWICLFFSFVTCLWCHSKEIDHYLCCNPCLLRVLLFYVLHLGPSFILSWFWNMVLCTITAPYPHKKQLHFSLSLLGVAYHIHVFGVPFVLRGSRIVWYRKERVRTRRRVYWETGTKLDSETPMIRLETGLDRPAPLTGIDWERPNQAFPNPLPRNVAGDSRHPDRLGKLRPIFIEGASFSACSAICRFVGMCRQKDAAP